MNVPFHQHCTCSRASHRNPHIRDLDDPRIPRLAHPYHRARLEGVVEVVTSGNNLRPDLANYPRPKRNLDGVCYFVHPVREEHDTASVGSYFKDLIDDVCIVRDTVAAGPERLGVEKFGNVLALVSWRIPCKDIDARVARETYCSGSRWDIVPVLKPGLSRFSCDDIPKAPRSYTTVAPG